MEGRDLTRYQKGGEEHDKVRELLGKLISGKSGYTTVLDESKAPAVLRCKNPNCNWPIEPSTKFCPECGSKQG